MDRSSGSDRVFLPSTLRTISHSGHLLFGQGRLVSSSPAGEPGRQTAQTVQSQSGFTYARPKPRPKRVRRPGRAGPQAAWRVQRRRLGTRKMDVAWDDLPFVQLELSQRASGGVTHPGGPAGSQLGLGPLPISKQTLCANCQAP
ncbi:hypothetical protein AB1E18_019617 [Capra hircus]